ncbi:2-amino-4-hydroxy-6-hydroxymethyldihydropteridine diphosphokinase [Haemophilus paraphrohaemolyticus]|uniref:2-amino-4-hydroxy-6-hydroxymethyldihydropteridine pyrophosphokinase n=1 Tax=Haemophilus paraphrohaemolyticus HK411 TaxID=1095743 RepID=I2NPY2_9PAST|nr:2-amino-4-hydroxy-6-hydroxymethyldihydropteridine diphosphokinase [Haemophilus paraphrohaemolyticus]EIG27893.1 2-amino-4-hydroxy-6-hydroxymethyldihydropteridine diphosphokinase [Haemophilus paraphrohaemolyticus HK411]OOR95263.1 2-amino-4-hydroxy-6-hydroxymethyldihydropteridine diphosphokinase [Haemophilus paraphrohaemolyticus]STP00813.1 2-amino-4-hydroxy-6-hydroxymethyldihydropteridinepyrophosphokinase [Haemophilus paraphrohaemolyticus]
MKTVYVALGSNLNDPLNQLKQAVQSLQAFAINFEVSPFYGSKPVGPQDQPDYVNAIVKFETDLTALELLDKLQHIENSQGRVRLRRWGERTLDLDIILYGNEQIQNERLTVPHIEMQNREFVIVPMYDLSPDLVLPSGQKLAEIYQRFKDHQMVVFE